MKTSPLGELEKQIMDIIWKSKHCSARDVLIKLQKNRKLAYTTVMTIMGRLVEKGILIRNLHGSSYLYQPRVSREKFVAKSIHIIFTTAISTLGHEAVTYFVKEIQKIDLKKREELLKMLDKKEDVVLLDVRNRYETRIGKFKNAIELDIDVFNEFPEKINKINGLKNKKIVMYCTGGVRCEKASAALLNQGVKDVYQLDGGILNYGKECSDAHWEGKCFVFDRRVSIPLDSTKEVHPISRCDICNEFSDIYVNCKNVECDKLFICCKNCQSRHKGYCPEEIN